MRASLACCRVVALCAALASVAGAADGTIEINHERALAGGVNGDLVADPAGYPVILTQPGSYRLTGNLTVSNANTIAISVRSSNVTLDLGGFAILGPVTCTGAPVTSCSASGLGSGVTSTSNFRNIAVVNGSVRGMGLGGVVLSGPDSRIEGVQATENATVGLSTLRAGTFVHDTATANGGNGIDAGDDSVITGAVARDNAVDGIHCGNGCSVVGSSGGANGDDGIETLSGGTVSQSAARGNGNDGIVVGAGSTVTGNTANGNAQDGLQVGASSTVTGNTGNANTGDGIETSSGCTITGNNVNSNGYDGISASAGSVLIGNTARSNTDFGFEIGAGGTYGENLLASNNAADPGDPRCVQVSPSSALEIAANSCNGSSCYCLAAGPHGDIFCRIPRLNLPLHPSDPSSCTP